MSTAKPRSNTHGEARIGNAHGKPHGNTHGKPHGDPHGNPHGKARGKARGKTHSSLIPPGPDQEEHIICFF